MPDVEIARVSHPPTRSKSDDSRAAPPWSRSCSWPASPSRRPCYCWPD